REHPGHQKPDHDGVPDGRTEPGDHVGGRRGDEDRQERGHRGDRQALDQRTGEATALKGRLPPLGGEARHRQLRALPEHGRAWSERNHEDQIEREKDEESRPDHPEGEGHLERHVEWVAPRSPEGRGAHRSTWNRATNFRYRRMNTMMMPNKMIEADPDVNGSFTGGRYLPEM